MDQEVGLLQEQKELAKNTPEADPKIESTRMEKEGAE